MSRKKPPTAIACVNDRTAVGALEAAEQLGLAIPSDLALIGHDDIEIASLVRPRLSTIRYPAHEAGSTCGRLLLERIAGRAGDVGGRPAHATGAARNHLTCGDGPRGEDGLTSCGALVVP